MSKNDIFATDPEKWTGETIAQAGERLRPIIERFHKQRKDLSDADVKVEAEKKAKRKKPQNLNLDDPL